MAQWARERKEIICLFFFAQLLDLVNDCAKVAKAYAVGGIRQRRCRRLHGVS
jgi:hypothetical protein